MRSFVHEQFASRVVFGVGSIDSLAAEVKQLGAKRAMVL
jgi:alcohol dehydrogenase class IV